MGTFAGTSWRRTGVFVVLASMLALAGCGRKGGLDLPPQAAAPVAAAPDAAEPGPARNGLFELSPAADAPPTATKGRNRRVFIDPLLD